MGLLSFFKRGAKAPAAKPVADSADAVQTLRVRARRRLIGAAVLVGLGVVGFPLVFETQPRPIPVDLPIDIPNKDKAPVLVIPPAASQVAAADEAAASQPEALAPQDRQQEVSPATATATVAKAEPPPVFVPPAPSAKPLTAKVSDKPSAKPSDKTSDKTSDKAIAKAKLADTSGEAARVQSLLEGRPAAKSSEASPAAAAAAAAATATGRFIVQFGAYADAKAAHDARMKVERLGIKTYAQEVQTTDGKRIRVRIGPYASRDEADKAAARVRSTGLSTAVLTI